MYQPWVTSELWLLVRVVDRFLYLMNLSCQESYARRSCGNGSLEWLGLAEPTEGVAWPNWLLVWGLLSTCVKRLIKATSLVLLCKRKVVASFPFIMQPLWHLKSASLFGLTQTPELCFQSVVLLSHKPKPRTGRKALATGHEWTIYFIQYLIFGYDIQY